MFGLLLRRVLHRLIRALVSVRMLPFLVLGLAIVAVGAGALQLVQLPALTVSLPGPKRAPDSTENYLRGNQNYNAELICGSLSDDLLDRLRSRSGSCLEVQQRQLEMARERGARLEQINYVGGYGLPDGTAYQFYVVAARGPGSRSETEYVTYIFTLDRGGKIARVQ